VTHLSEGEEREGGEGDMWRTRSIVGVGVGCGVGGEEREGTCGVLGSGEAPMGSAQPQSRAASRERSRRRPNCSTTAIEKKGSGLGQWI
jgi:hypothetical protein